MAAAAQPPRSSSSAELVHLNVGGSLYTTSAATLTGPAAHGSMLARLASLHLDAAAAASSGGGAAAGSSADSSNNAAGAGSGSSGAAPLMAAALMSDARVPGGVLFIDLAWQMRAPSARLVLEVQQLLNKLASMADNGEKGLKELEATHELLGVLRSYLAPKLLYHTGKRGGPNYNRPRFLGDDLEASLNELGDDLETSLNELKEDLARALRTLRKD